MAQKATSRISGVVVSEAGEKLTDVVIYLKNTNYHTTTDNKGTYQLTVPTGNYTIFCSGLGYLKQFEDIIVQPGKTTALGFTLKYDPNMVLDEVVVSSKFGIKEIRESAFNVVALDAKSLYNTSMNLGSMLNRASGVKVRSSGGVGSSMSISLNGFTGRRIKLFMDGVPMEGFGSAFQLNNIPVTVANRIEVYKGVVPIEFGADAIGGAINIVTNQTENTFVDASYSFGSFNTHKPSISVGHTSKNGFSFQLNAFMNYSDNNYKVHLNKMLDISTGGYIAGDYLVERFHDTYQNKTIMAKIGFVRKWWTDRFFIGLTTGKEERDIQNANTLEIVYGARTRSASTLLPSLEYYKKNFLVKKLTFRLTSNFNYNHNINIDTAARSYNWYGNYMATRTKGEGGTNTLSEYNNKNFSSTANLAYKIIKNHSITVNNVVTRYNRKLSSNVPAEELTAADTMRRGSVKNVLGVSYQYSHNGKWNANLFGKHYFQHVIGPVDTLGEVSHSSYEEQERYYQTMGYGLAVTYFVNEKLQLKTSVEKAFKLPSAQQLFGDEAVTSSNSSLKPENSFNINLGGSLNQKLGNNNTVYVDISGYYRLNKNFIRQVQSARYGTISNVNFGRVRNIGVDVEARYYFKNKLMIGGTVTYMDLRNKEKLRDAQSSVNAATYNNRMPNIPYFYGNTDATYYIHDLWGKGNVLSLNYNFNFVGKFYLLWESQGSANTKATLPKQLYHDFSASYSLKNGKYNISVESLNFTNAILYDNWSLQKPGRSFNIKLRYYWNTGS
ncbi:TonB-dependent receptor [Flammeovirgaceae bacterium SG7u.111]|nr:TonB-dependent receptor [Flammeovirgaceae bacterium SG7u.132]WPO37201.1 TonB-dependent receptor [Flammeovirgaceae bacterium SG7u.111]